MTDMICEQTQSSLAEYALGILPDDEERGVSEHIRGCDRCRREASELRHVGDLLLDLVPDAEPNLGFDQRVLARLEPHAPARPARRPENHRDLLGRRRYRPSRRVAIAVSSVAAALVAAVVIPLAVMSGSHHRTPAELTATLREDGRPVGSVYLSGNPLWVYMTVQGETPGGSVNCQLIRDDGTSVDVGAFQLVKGNGSWATSVSGPASQYAGARLVTRTGVVVARATF